MSRASVRDLPSILLIFAVLFSAGALCFLLISYSSVPEENDLRTISGVVDRAPYITGPGRGGYKLHVFLQGSDRIHDLTQDDISGFVPGGMDGVMALRLGDRVTAQVQPDSLGRDFDWLWEMQRDGVTILTYQDTHTFYEDRNMRTRQLALWLGALGFALFPAAFLGRRHFGAWRDKKRGASRP